MQFITDAFVESNTASPLVFDSVAPGGYQFYGQATLEQINNVTFVDLEDNLEQTQKLRFENKASMPMWINW